MKKVSLSWSGGKDSMLTLHRAIQDRSIEVVHLHTFINPQGRVSIHELPVELLRAQAEALGLPLIEIRISDQPGSYEEQVRVFYKEQDAMLDGILFGDIFLRDLREYKQGLIREFDLEPILPLWEEPTDQLLKEFNHHFRAVVCATQDSEFGEKWIGKWLHEVSFPDHVDPCGENGEYHTFVFDGDLFKQPVAFSIGVPRKVRYSLRNSEGEVREYGQWVVDIGYVG